MLANFSSFLPVGDLFIWIFVDGYLYTSLDYKSGQINLTTIYVMLKTYFNQFCKEFWINFNTFFDYESFASKQKKILFKWKMKKFPLKMNKITLSVQQSVKCPCIWSILPRGVLLFWHGIEPTKLSLRCSFLGQELHVCILHWSNGHEFDHQNRMDSMRPSLQMTHLVWMVLRLQPKLCQKFKFYFFKSFSIKIDFNLQKHTKLPQK